MATTVGGVSNDDSRLVIPRNRLPEQRRPLKQGADGSAVSPEGALVDL